MSADEREIVELGREDAAARDGIGGEGGRQDLDGDRPLEGDVAGQQHDPHAAPAELALDRVAAGEQVLQRQERGVERGHRARWAASAGGMRCPPPSCRAAGA